MQLSGEIVRSITRAGCHPCGCCLWKSAQRTEIKLVLENIYYLRRQQRAVAESALSVSRPTLKYLAHSTCKHAPADILPTRHAASSHADNVYTHKQQAPIGRMRLAYAPTGAYFLSNSLHSTKRKYISHLSPLRMTYA